MTAYVFGTCIVTAAVAANLKDMSRRLDKAHCAGMFTTGLSATGQTPITHYISTGAIPQVYAQTLNSDTLLYTRAKKAWEDDGDVFPFTQAQVTNAHSKCDFSTDDPFIAMARMGLQPVRSAV